VVKVLKPGTYKLANKDGEELTNAWNIQQLRRFSLSKDFQVFCCKLHAQHPSWQPRCKNQQVNKVKGQLGFPQKTKSPLGPTAGGGAPHPKKMVPFFRKSSQAR
jgi:hypothetical protein